LFSFVLTLFLFEMRYKHVLAIVISCSVYNDNMCLALVLICFVVRMTYKLVLTVVLVCSDTSFVLF
jgi:hypothetical protein